jgi:ABC-type multidrug transport system fused ATPase/permease subunit
MLLAVVTAAGVAQSFAYLPLAAVLRRTFDVVLPARDRAGLWIAVGELLALQMFTLALGWGIRMTALRAGQAVVSQLRRECLQRLYELPREFHTAADAERLHVTLVYETNWIEGMSNALVVRILPATLCSVVLFALLFWTEPRYAVIIAVCAPGLFAANRLMARTAWLRQELLRRAFQEFSCGVRFAIAAMDLTKSQAAEAVELRRQGGNVEVLRSVSLDLFRFDSVQQLLQSALLLAGTVAVLLAGGWAVAGGRATGGQIMAFYVITALFAAQARTIVESVPAVRMGLRAFTQTAALLETPEREPYGGSETVESLDCLRLESVGFAYPGGRPILEDATLEILRGRRVALIGANGSGKSTLLFLILGLYRPSRGSLAINGRPYDRFDMRSLRSHVAVVPQTPFLFADTIRANVGYGAGELSSRAIRDALEWAGAAGFVDELPNGIDTQIGEQGGRLSGGQRQRLAIARALLRRPDLLILDEPTNHLDEDGVSGLMESLDGLPFRPAVIVVSHEWRVLRHTDEAWRLEDGRLHREAVECGS